MANPQLEDGYFRIAREFWKAMRSIRIPGEARRVFDFIIEKTWGWSKKEDWISLSQFSESLGISRAKVIKHRKTLIEMNLIMVEDTRPQKGTPIAIKYRVNKDFETWRPVPKKGPPRPHKGNEPVPIRGMNPVPKRGPTIDTLTKDNLQKTGVSAPKKRETDPHIRVVLDYFHETHLRTKGLKPILDSKAAALSKKILNAYGLDKTKSLIDDFFDTEDEFIQEAGFSFGVFYSQVQKLATRTNAKRDREAWVAEMEAKEAREAARESR